MKAFLLLLVCFFGTEAMAQTKGCLRVLGTKYLVDVNCECIKNKTCAPMRELKYSASFYDIRDEVKNQAVFTQNEKAKMKETYDLYNKIIKLQSEGKSRTPEIKALYKRLDQVNTEVRASYIKTKPALMKVAQTEHKEMLKEKAQRKTKIQQKARAYLSSNKAQGAASVATKNEVTIKASDIAARANVLTDPKREESYVLYKEIAKGDKAKEDNEHILKNIKSRDQARSEEDSLFDIITKSYIRTAYPILLKED